jgi:O-antigen/teichoic acid export membrane protein
LSRVKANFAYTIAGAAIPIASALITVPIYIHTIGAPRYGIVAIAGLLLGYFGFLDFGLSRASANALSRLAGAPPSERSPVIMTAIYMNLALGAAGGLAMFAAGQLLLDHVFTMPNGLRDEAMAAFPWIAAMLPLGMLGGVATGVLESRERFGLSSLVTCIGNVAGQVLPMLAALLVSPTLPTVVPVMLLVKLAVVAATFAAVIRIERPLGWRDFHSAWVRRLFGYGLWVSVSSLISPLLDGLDQMLIAAALGPAAVAHYAVPMNLALRSQLVAVALARTLFPQLSRATPAEAGALAARACVALAYGFGAVCGPAIIVSDAFLRLWVGDEFAAVASPVAAILLAGAWINGIAFIPNSLLQGQGRPDLPAKLHLAEFVPFVAVLWWLMAQFGLPGAAAAWTLRVSVDCLALLLLARFPLRSLLQLAPAALMVTLCLALATRGLRQPLLAASVAGCLFIAAGLVVVPPLRRTAVALLRWRPLSRR